MANKISKEEVEHVAKLTRLHLTTEEVGKFTEQLGEVLEYVDRLPEGDGFKIYDLRFKNNAASLREDNVSAIAASTKELMQNAPQTEGTSIKVPAVLGGDDE